MKSGQPATKHSRAFIPNASNIWRHILIVYFPSICEYINISATELRVVPPALGAGRVVVVIEVDDRVAAMFQLL